MFKYTQLNDDNVVIGISQLSGEVIAVNMILINDIDVELGSTYNRITGDFTPPEPHPDPEYINLEEIQTQTLLNTEYLVVMSELSNL